jgi:hypothetical protein
MGLGSGIRKKPIPDPGSMGRKGTGSRIPDPDPQHWMKMTLVKSLNIIINLKRKQHTIRREIVAVLLVVRIVFGEDEFTYFDSPNYDYSLSK